MFGLVEKGVPSTFLEIVSVTPSWLNKLAEP
jgi:hypothetical protein